MKKVLLSICIFALVFLVACGSEDLSTDLQEENVAEETEVEAAPIDEDDFLVLCENETEEINILEEFNEGQTEFRFWYYDPNYDESREGLVKTHRGIIIGDSKEKVIEAYGDGIKGDFDINNDYCYEAARYVEIPAISDVSDVSAVMSSQCVSFIRYTFDRNYTISFYFDDRDELSWIFFTKNE